MRRRAAAALLAIALAAGCATPVELGDRRYREGDRLGALEIWRRIDPDSLYFELARRRIAEVEQEFGQLVVRYKKRARYYESRERLAESVLNYRLALALQPEDHETLAHVQELVKSVNERKLEAQARFQEAFAAGELASARSHLEALRRVDPFDPRLQADARRLDDALSEKLEALLAAGREGFASGRHADAEQAFRAALDLEPENGDAQGYLAYLSTIRAEAGSGKETGRSPTRLPASQREIRAEGYYRNGLAAEKDQRPFAAIRHALRALQLSPQHAGARRHLRALRAQLAPKVEELIEDGRVHYEEEELQSALDSWRRALLIQPRNAKAREYVARAEHMLQNLEQLRADPTSQVGTR